MQRQLITIFTVFALVSCSTNSNTQASELASTDEFTTQSSETDNNEEVNDEEEANASLEFNVFEDYAQLRSKQALIDAFGKENLKHGSSWYAEGTVELKHTIIRNPANGHRIKYLWDQDQPSNLSSIEASYFEYNENYEILSKQKISSICGLYTGMSINDLRKWTEEDFNFSGFGWDYEGAVFVMPGTKLSKCPISIKLTLEHHDNMDQFDELYGDIELSTASKLVRKAPIIVDLMVYHIEQ